MAWVDVWVLSRSRSLRGVSMGTAVLFTVWPMWDLLYYTGLNQDLSAIACCLLLAGRASWLALAIMYYDQ